MVKIRLTRSGGRGNAFYRIVAIDERRSRDSRPLEFLGTYDPNQKPEAVHLRADRVADWVSRGAQISPTVKSLMRRARKGAAAGAAS